MASPGRSPPSPRGRRKGSVPALQACALALGHQLRISFESFGCRAESEINVAVGAGVPNSWRSRMACPQWQNERTNNDSTSTISKRVRDTVQALPAERHAHSSAGIALAAGDLTSIFPRN